MKKIVQLFILFLFINSFSASAQTANWTPVLPANFPVYTGWIGGISRVSQMKFHPTDPKKMYAISARGGLFISSDTGNNWTIARGCDFMPTIELASVCIDHTNDQVIYLGTGDANYSHAGLGVWKSINGGQTFSQTALSGKLVREMIMDPTDHNIIVAVTDQGIYKTIDAGANWVQRMASTRLEDLKQKTPVSRVLYATSRDSAFYRSFDFGDNWTQVLNTIVLPPGVTNATGCKIAVTPADTNIVYLGMVANGGLVYRSTNGGTTFSIMKTAGSPYLTYYSNSASSYGQGFYNFAIGTDRINANILYLVAHNVWRSTDGGVSWNQLESTFTGGGSCHTDMHQVVKSPYNNNQLWNMNDGGVWLSKDGGFNWLPKSAGIYGIEIYHGVCSPTKKETIIIGTQDNGSLYANNTNWVVNGGGDVTTKWAFDYRPNSTMYYAYDDSYRRTIDPPAAQPYLPNGLTRFHEISFNRINPDLAFICQDTAVYRTTNLTAVTPTWTMIYHQGTALTSVHSSQADPNRLYVANMYFVFYSSNALSVSPVFTKTDTPGSFGVSPARSVKSSPNRIYMTGYYLGKAEVFRSDDNGATWELNSYNASVVTTAQLLSDEYSTNELVFLASGNSVYYKVKNANSWSVYSDNLPLRTDITDMSIYNDGTSNSRLRVSMYGRGVWETPIDNLRTLNAKFEADDINPCMGEAVHFSDISTGHITSRVWSFPGGNPSSSTAEFPVVTYNTRGSFDVTLTVFDGAASSIKTKSLYISTAAATLPLVEGFEGADDPPYAWKNIDNSIEGVKWKKTDVKAGYNAGGHSMLFDNYINANGPNITGEKDELQVRRLNLADYDTVTLSFDLYYYNYGVNKDSLAVLVSTDCGQTFTKVYQKGGNILSSYNTPSHWRTDTVNLDAFAGQPDVIIQFQNISRNGNDIYIDNVNITGTLATTVYTFTGNGNWTVAANWLNNIIPPAILTGNKQIIIDPVPNGECVLNITQQINSSAMLKVKPGKKFRVIGNLNINN